jgi:predicted AAA+ superfamily ATPase
MGGLHNKFGKIAEHLVAPGIAKRFNEMGFRFGSVSPGGHRILDEQGKIKTEVDILLENGDYIVAVEVKTRPALKDIEHHIKRLEILREHRNKIRDYRKIQGAIAGAVFGTEAKAATIEAGMYVLEQSGDTMKMEIPDGFKAREW